MWVAGTLLRGCADRYAATYKFIQRAPCRRSDRASSAYYGSTVVPDPYDTFVRQFNCYRANCPSDYSSLSVNGFRSIFTDADSLQKAPSVSVHPYPQVRAEDGELLYKVNSDV